MTTTTRKRPRRTKTIARRQAAKRPAKPSKAKALSLHIGLNSVDPKHYAGWSGDLLACENDARDMAVIAAAKGMTSTVLLTPQATRKRVLTSFRAAARRLKAGDLFFLSYSGHG